MASQEALEGAIIADQTFLGAHSKSAASAKPVIQVTAASLGLVLQPQWHAASLGLALEPQVTAAKLSLVVGPQVAAASSTPSVATAPSPPPSPPRAPAPPPLPTTETELNPLPPNVALPSPTAESQLDPYHKALLEGIKKSYFVPKSTSSPSQPLQLPTETVTGTARPSPPLTLAPPPQLPSETVAGTAPSSPALSPEPPPQPKKETASGTPTSSSMSSGSLARPAAKKRPLPVEPWTDDQVPESIALEEGETYKWPAEA